MNPNGQGRQWEGADGSDPLKSLESKLYSPNVSREELFPDDRRNLMTNTPPRDQGVQWEPVDIAEQPDKPQRVGLAKAVRIFFIFSFLFCFGAVAFALYYFFSDQLVISSKNIDINVSAPVRVNGGEVLPLSIEIANKNRQELRDIRVTVEYPEDSRDPRTPDKTLVRDEHDIALITGGSSQTISSSALVYGEEKQEKTVLVKIEYGIASTKSRFSKEKEYAFIIDRSPFSVDVQHQSELDAGQEAVFTLTVSSNVEVPIDNVLLVGTFPFNFTMSSADPVPLQGGTNMWLLGTVAPGKKKTITIRGVINGLTDEERSFRFVIGTAKPEADNEIGTTLSSKTVSVKVHKPTVAIEFASRNQARDGGLLATFSELFDVNFSVRNNLDQLISRPTVEFRAIGQYHDPQSLRGGDGGFFRSSDQVVLWAGTSQLTLQPGGKNDYNANMQIKNLQSFGANLKNPTFDIEVTVKGTILDESGRSKQIEVKSRQPVHFSTSIAGTASVLFSGGPYSNQGPIPPMADTPTTLTLRLQASNGINHVSDAVMRTTLPIYMEYVSSSASPNVVYNDFNRSLTWTIGELPAYTGMGTAPATADIQLSITPSTSQRGASPVITAPIVFEGIDRITGATLRQDIAAPSIQTIDGRSDLRVQ